MVLVFDLDDTLYDERTYVESGFRAVAAFGAAEFGWDAEASFKSLVTILNNDGRGKVFDVWLAEHGRNSKYLVNRCLLEYRRHFPSIAMFPSATKLLEAVGAYPKYVVTDGNKLVQGRKVDALKISPLFLHVYVTHRYGIRNAKPSIFCFDLIRKREKCAWEDMVYIGDNPEKDFVGLNRTGAKTIRVLTGAHRNSVATQDYDAQITIPSLDSLLGVLQEI